MWEKKNTIYLSTKARNEIVACLFLFCVINLSSLDNGFFRTNIKAISTVQATVLNNSCVSACKINTSLRTDYNTFLTTDTLICYIIAVNCFYTVSKWKRFSINRFFWKVKPFSASVINSKHGKSYARLFGVIDFVHIAVFSQTTCSDNRYRLPQPFLWQKLQCMKACQCLSSLSKKHICQSLIEHKNSCPLR